MDDKKIFYLKDDLLLVNLDINDVLYIYYFYC